MKMMRKLIRIPLIRVIEFDLPKILLAIIVLFLNIYLYNLLDLKLNSNLPNYCSWILKIEFVNRKLYRWFWSNFQRKKKKSQPFGEKIRQSYSDCFHFSALQAINFRRFQQQERQPMDGVDTVSSRYSKKKKNCRIQ